MTWRDQIRPQNVAVDVSILAVLLVGANLVIDRAHPGWANLNPSPYILLPLLIGGRYGFTVGLLSGAATSVLIVAWQVAAGHGSVRSVLGHTPFLLASLPFLGGVAGELFHWLRREQLTTAAQLEKARVSVRRLDADVRYLRGVKDELDRTVAARDGEVSTLDAELRRLYATPSAEIPEAILQFLKRQVRLADAALYAVDAIDQPLRRLHAVGNESHLPEMLPTEDRLILRLAVSRGSLVTLPELLRHSSPPENERILLAAPLPDADDQVRTLLVVTGLPFISFTPQSANLIALICEWGGEVLDLASGAAGRYRVAAGTENQRIFTRAHLLHLFRLSLDAYERHRLPSSVVVFELPGAAGDDQSRFEKVLLGAVRAGDFAAELDWEHPHLAVLLPLTGERGANIFMDRCRQLLQPDEVWPVHPVIRRIDIGHTEDVAGIVAELEHRAPPGPAPEGAAP